MKETMTLELTRQEVCRLLVACTACNHASEGKSWKELHDKIKNQMEEADFFEEWTRKHCNG